MLVALNRNQEVVNTISQRVSKFQGPFTCPACRSAVRFKKGRVLRPHFAHIHRESCQFFAENESAEHLNLKGHLYNWARQSSVRSVKLEHFLPEIGQVADLWLEGRLALEVQCSPLPIERLRERTFAYHDSGYEVVWLLGKKLWLKETITDLQKQLVSFSLNRGFHIWELDEEREELRLKYLIHEDLHGKVQYLTQIFKFGQGELLDCLRQPFVEQALVQFQGREDKDITRYVAKQLQFCNTKWLAKQAVAYLEGKNLLTQTREDFFPQIRPLAFTDFTQIRINLLPYYQNFMSYYKNLSDKSTQILYSPIFYDKIKSTEDLHYGKK